MGDCGKGHEDSLVKIAFTFDREVGEFLDRLTAAELREMFLFEVQGHRVFQVWVDDKPTDEYCAYLTFPNSSPEIILAEPVVEVVH